MCLDTKKKEFKGSQKAVTRYKVMRVYENGKQILQFPNRQWEHFKKLGGDLDETEARKDLPLNTWLSANQNAALAEDYFKGGYKAGFHVFKSLEDAEKCLEDSSYLHKSQDAIFEVRIKGIYIEGAQDGIPVQVARKLKIVKQLTEVI